MYYKIYKVINRKYYTYFCVSYYEDRQRIQKWFKNYKLAIQFATNL